MIDRALKAARRWHDTPGAARAKALGDGDGHRHGPPGSPTW
jgi:hypothetical protein